MLVYFNNQFVPIKENDSLSGAETCFMPKSEVRISPDDRGFTFGDGIYEVIRAYRGYLFEIERHLARLERSQRSIEMPVWDYASIAPILTTLLKKNNLTGTEAKIYIQITRGDAPRDHAFPGNNTPLTIFITATEIPPRGPEYGTGVAAIFTDDNRWTRCDIKQIGLLPGVMANQQARSAGAHEALFVRDGIITEGTHTNFCTIIDGTLHTHPADNLILPGITLAVVLDICAELGIPVVEKGLARTDLLGLLDQSDARLEAMILGTITEILPIVKIDNHVIGDGQPGPFTRRIIDSFYRRTNG